MFKEIVSFEEKLIARIDFQNFIKRLDPEIQQIFYNAYGKQLEKMPTIYLLNDRFLRKVNDFLEIIDQVCSVPEQKVLLMRYGIITGRQMTIQEIADRIGVCPIILRLIEIRVSRRLSTKKILEYLES